MNLTNEQQIILDNCDQNLFINAGPGSGKSSMLSKITEKLLLNPDNFVLLITFTNKAAKSIIAKCSDVDQKRIIGGTFHGLANLFSKKNGIFWNICDEGKKRLIIRKTFNCKKDKTKLEEIVEEISLAKSEWPLITSNNIIKYNNELVKYNLIDFDDMIYSIINLIPTLKFPKITHVLVDELQDTNSPQLEMLKVLHDKLQCKMLSASDLDQCCVEGSLVNTKNGKVKIEDIKIGDLVETFNGNSISTFFPVTNKSTVNHRFYYKIITDKGELNLTYNHLCYVKPVFNNYFVYLMYRYDKGFRIGKSKNNPELRSRSEKADKIWIMDIFDKNEDAALEEDRLSLKYSIPKQTYVLHSKTQIMRNNDLLFNEFGNNGFKLLEDKNLLFDNPIIQPQTAREKRLAIGITQTKPKNRKSTNFAIICESRLLGQINFLGINQSKRRKNTFYLRKEFSNYKDAFYFAIKLKNKLQEVGITGELQERINYNKTRYVSINAAQIKKDFKFLSSNNLNIEEATVLSVTKIFSDINAYDLEVQKTGKIFIDNHLVHNCIYAWRGARPENVQDFIKIFNCKVLNMGINFRSARSIVQCSRRLIELNKNRIKKEIKEFKTEHGVVSAYESYNPLDEIKYIISKCKQNRETKIAILYRNRLYKNHLEFELKKQGLKYCVNDSLEISDRSAIKVMISSMKLAASIGDIYDLEIASKGLIGIGKTTVEHLKKELGDKNLSDLLRDKFFDPKNHKKYDSLISIRSYFNNNKDNNLGNLALLIEKYFIKSFDYQEDMKNFIHDITKDYKISASNIREISNDLGLDGKEENQDNGALIELSTLHGFKGLQRPIVIIPWCNQFDPQQGKDYNIEDERRLFYVGITRAESKLYLSYSSSEPRFIMEMKI